MNNCTNYANVTGAESPTNHIGGIAGINQGKIDNPTIQAYGMVTISSPTEGDIDKCYLGGLSGENNGGYIGNGNIYNNIKLVGGKANSIYTGGLVAYNTNNGTIENIDCYITVTGGTGTTIACTGGLVALNNAILSACKIRNNVTGGSANKTYTGGLVGMNDTNGNMIDSYTQQGCTVFAGTGTAINYTGIFVGNNTGTIYFCCQAGGNQSENEMDLVGNGSGPLSWEVEESKLSITQSTKQSIII